MQRLAQYQSIVDLFAGKRILEVGCGDGASARFLAEHGATEVIGVDTDEHMIAEAARLHGLRNLSFRREDYRRLDLDRATVDWAIVPEGAALIRTKPVLDELRRVVRPGGGIVVMAACADRPGGRGGASYRDLVARLSPLFEPVRVLGQAHFCAWSLARITEESGELIDDVVLDRTLLSDGSVDGHDAFDADTDADTKAKTESGTTASVFSVPPMTHYVAVCGGAAPALVDALTIVEVPSDGAESLRDAVAAEPVIQRHSESAEITELEVALTAAHRELEDTRAALEQTQTSLGHTREELAATTIDLAQIQSAMERVTAEAQTQSPDELSALRAELAEALGRLAASEQARGQLERDLEDVEETRAELEDSVAETEAAVEELRTDVSATDAERAARAEANGRDHWFLTRSAEVLERDVGELRALLDELDRGLTSAASADASTDGTSTVGSMMIDLGVKEAELTLLNIGLSSLQKRVDHAVGQLHEARDAEPDADIASTLSRIADALTR